MILFTGREMSGTGHEHVIRLWWLDTSDNVEKHMDIETATRWLDAPGHRAFVEDRQRPGLFVEAFVVKPATGRWYIRTKADGRWTDNLLALPIRRLKAA